MYKLSSSTATILRSDGSGGGKCSLVWIRSDCVSAIVEVGAGDAVVIVEGSAAVGGGDTCACPTSTGGESVFEPEEYHTAPPSTMAEAARPIVRLFIFMFGRDEPELEPEPELDPFDGGVGCIEGSG